MKDFTLNKLFELIFILYFLKYYSSSIYILWWSNGKSNGEREKMKNLCPYLGKFLHHFDRLHAQKKNKNKNKRQGTDPIDLIAWWSIFNVWSTLIIINFLICKLQKMRSRFVFIVVLSFSFFLFCFHRDLSPQTFWLIDQDNYCPTNSKTFEFCNLKLTLCFAI